MMSFIHSFIHSFIDDDEDEGEEKEKEEVHTTERNLTTPTGGWGTSLSVSHQAIQVRSSQLALCIMQSFNLHVTASIPTHA